ncbi:DUF6262 family protein [Nonomuraea spiralis]|uniref:DUF6262 family protein n=1 Tax=Nonomuraea spiralis TaxID=46182 RepID=A0ABV5IG28_9ACTN|nr:DUF6262 family protein [Nonomuraea spiralis]GGT30664.1 hypothetical protein GCM10010176_089100 [Nonomuraea spiralis]
MRADNTHHIVDAARRRAEWTRQRAIAALRRIDAVGRHVTFDAVARQAKVSRSWLYTQDDLRAEIEHSADDTRLRPRCFRLGVGAPPIRRCCADWRLPRFVFAHR